MLAVLHEKPPCEDIGEGGRRRGRQDKVWEEIGEREPWTCKSFEPLSAFQPALSPSYSSYFCSVHFYVYFNHLWSCATLPCILHLMPQRLLYSHCLKQFWEPDLQFHMLNPKGATLKQLPNEQFLDALYTTFQKFPKLESLKLIVLASERGATEWNANKESVSRRKEWSTKPNYW